MLIDIPDGSKVTEWRTEVIEGKYHIVAILGETQIMVYGYQDYKEFIKGLTKFTEMVAKN